MATELKPCPKCGKKPKIRYYPPNAATAECKQLLRKPHLSAYVNYAPPSQLQTAIVDAWNRMVAKWAK